MKPEVLRSQIELELCGDFFGWFLMNSPHYLDVLNGDLSEVPFIVLGKFGWFFWGGTHHTCSSKPYKFCFTENGRVQRFGWVPVCFLPNFGNTLFSLFC